MGDLGIQEAREALAAQVEVWPGSPSDLQVKRLLFVQWAHQQEKITEFPTGRRYAKYYEKPKKETTQG